MIESGSVIKSVSSLSNLGWISSAPIDYKLCSRSLTIFPWIMGPSFWSLFSLFQLRGLSTQRTTDLTMKNWTKEGIKYLRLFLICCHCVFHHMHRKMEILLSVPFVASVFTETFLIVFCGSIQIMVLIQFRWRAFKGLLHYLPLTWKLLMINPFYQPVWEETAGTGGRGGCPTLFFLIFVGVF